MFTHVYVLRNGGKRVASTDLLEQQPVRGWLQYKQVPLDDLGPRWEAHLLTMAGGKPLLRPLNWARLRRVEGVMHLVGREDCGRQSKKASPAWRRQSWMCAFDPADARPFLQRMAAAAAARPYDPLEDDRDDFIDPLAWQPPE